MASRGASDCGTATAGITEQLKRELATRFGYESFKSPLQEKAVVAVHGGWLQYKGCVQIGRLCCLHNDEQM